jgi:hypothetical protein
VPKVPRELCRPRGVICITWEVIDKAGFNQLLVPHQSPLASLPSLSNQTCQLSVCLTLFLSILLANQEGLLLWRLSSTTAATRGSRGVQVFPLTLIQLPSTRGLHCLTQRMTCSRTFTWMICLLNHFIHWDKANPIIRVRANKRISCHRLIGNFQILGNLWGILELSRIVPSDHIFWPSSFFFFAPSSCVTQGHSARKQQKHLIKPIVP